MSEEPDPMDAVGPAVPGFDLLLKAAATIDMSDFIDTDEDDSDGFDGFGKVLFEEEPIYAPGLAPILEVQDEDTAADAALDAAESAIDESVEQAVSAEKEVSESLRRPQRLVASPAFKAAREEEESKKESLALSVVKRLAPRARKRSGSSISADDVSVWSKGTIAKKFLVPGIRLEELPANTQAKIIHGTENYKKACDVESPCALCGFKFKDRGSVRKGKVVETAISYDHFIPINFAAIIFRVVSTPGKYSADEFKILSLIGDMVCWHCNYTKGQTMFITCPVGSGAVGFDRLIVNEPAISNFYTKLLESKTSWAYNTTDTTKTSLSKCLAGGNPEEWKASRVALTIKRSQGVINVIKEKVDFAATKTRLGLARATVREALKTLEKDERWIQVGAAMQAGFGNKAVISDCLKRRDRMRKAFVAKFFAAKEVDYLLPWKKGVIRPGTEENSVEPFSPITPAHQPAQKARTPGSRPGSRPGSLPSTPPSPPPGPPPAKRGRTAGRRKTRRRRLPKLI